MQEQEAIRQCQAGEQKALGVLFQLHQQAVFQTAYGITRNYDLAEDITQQVFIELLTAIKKYDLNRPFPPWLHRIAVHRSLDELRRARLTTDRNSPMPDGVEFPEPGPDLEKRVIDSELAKSIWAAVGTLRPKHRAVVVLYYYHGFSEDEIAEALHCRTGTVKSRLHYARAHLRDALRGLREPPTDPDPVIAVAPKLSPAPSAQHWPIQTCPEPDERRMKRPALSIQRKTR